MGIKNIIRLCELVAKVPYTGLLLRSLLLHSIWAGYHSGLLRTHRTPSQTSIGARVYKCKIWRGHLLFIVLTVEKAWQTIILSRTYFLANESRRSCGGVPNFCDDTHYRGLCIWYVVSEWSISAIDCSTSAIACITIYPQVNLHWPLSLFNAVEQNPLIFTAFVRHR